MPSISKKISFPDNELMRALCGEQNAHLNLIEKKIGGFREPARKCVAASGWGLGSGIGRKKYFRSFMRYWNLGILSISMM